jgi:hypothetical protein
MPEEFALPCQNRQHDLSQSCAFRSGKFFCGAMEVCGGGNLIATGVGIE